MGLAQRLVMIVVCITMLGVTKRNMGRKHDYGEALSKSILFFEGQMSGKLPPTQRMTWRKDSALQDGSQLTDTRFFDKDELVWGAAWLFKATKTPYYRNYIEQNIHNLKNFAEFGWDSKDAGINVLVSKLLFNSASSSPFVLNADKFVCAVLPESPSVSVSYSKGGLLFKPGGVTCSMQQHSHFLFWGILAT